MDQGQLYACDRFWPRGLEQEKIEAPLMHVDYRLEDSSSSVWSPSADSPHCPSQKVYALTLKQVHGQDRRLNASTGSTCPRKWRWIDTTTETSSTVQNLFCTAEWCNSRGASYSTIHGCTRSAERPSWRNHCAATLGASIHTFAQPIRTCLVQRVDTKKK